MTLHTTREDLAHLQSPGTHLVFRFESDDGAGCFRNGDAMEYDASCNFGGFYDMPDPSMDDGEVHEHYVKGTIRGSLVFGFSSLCQLMRVAPCPHGRLNMIHSKIHVYAVPLNSLFTSSAQCVFYKDKAKLVGELDKVTLALK